MGFSFAHGRCNTHNIPNAWYIYLHFDLSFEKDVGIYYIYSKNAVGFWAKNLLHVFVPLSIREALPVKYTLKTKMCNPKKRSFPGFLAANCDVVKNVTAPSILMNWNPCILNRI